MTRIALGLEYDGAAFNGWQKQPNAPSVQAALEAALAEIAGLPVATICAGRTDSGVHAAGQVVHFDCPAVRPLSAWIRGVNRHLPDHVAVLWAKEVPDDFHARFAALSRRYRYLLCNRASRPGLEAGRIGWCFDPLDLQAMQEAAALLIGEHDFSAFRAAECQAHSPVRRMSKADVRQCGERFVFEFEANAFLQHMVRNLVGALVYVGKGRWDRPHFAQVLACRDRALSAPTFAPDGLYFLGATYAPAWGLPGPATFLTP
ncbi:MAG: tRNA pseudouridine(38-40) synthase TruA [Zoogloeaceae bacterium]|jgi:tRNA pseudouridine38-40 synthase|nr:tRNA pseudouridine(38-40) synthase TruA [Zoogloeaceae bacterium]